MKLISEKGFYLKSWLLSLTKESGAALFSYATSSHHLNRSSRVLVISLCLTAELSERISISLKNGQQNNKVNEASNVNANVYSLQQNVLGCWNSLYSLQNNFVDKLKISVIFFIDHIIFIGKNSSRGKGMGNQIFRIPAPSVLHTMCFNPHFTGKGTEVLRI